MRVGDFEIRIVSGGRFLLDGGAMFGIIPRPLWTRVCQPDERGRIPMETNCLLVRTTDELVLVDTGNGTKLPQKEAEFFALEPAFSLLPNLAAAGVRPEEITCVLFTHLHMDHAGGASHLSGGEPVPSFPNARFIAQRQEWEDAVANRSHMRASYRPENLLPLERSGRLELLDGDAEILPGISVRVTGGHTRAHQSVLIRSGGETLLYPADVCPTPAHFRGPYNMAYDMEPYITMLAKARLLAQAADEGWTLVFDHEPTHRAARVERDGEQFRPVPVDV